MDDISAGYYSPPSGRTRVDSQDGGTGRHTGRDLHTGKNLLDSNPPDGREGSSLKKWLYRTWSRPRPLYINRALAPVGDRNDPNAHG